MHGMHALYFNAQDLSDNLDSWMLWHSICLIIAALLASYLQWIVVVPLVGSISMLYCVAIWLQTQRHFFNFGLANSITLMRLGILFLVPIWSSMQDEFFVAVVVLFLLLDGVDGRVARARQEESEFGARFDMETDALAILFLCLGVHLYHGMGFWILWLGLIRYAFVLFRAWYSADAVSERRSQWGRVIYIFLVTSIGLRFVTHHGLTDMLLWTATLMVTLSFWQDVKQLIQNRKFGEALNQGTAKVSSGLIN